MRAVIDWSYDLLTDAERVLFRRVSVFSGWTIEAEETVCADAPLEAAHILDIHSSLVEKSLVVADLQDCTARYRLLEVTRAYATEKLGESGERDTLALRHARWMAEFAERVYDDYWDTTLENWLPPVRTESNNARAALSWALGNANDPALGARIVAGMAGFWLQQGVLSEGKEWIDAALAVVDESEHPEIAGRLYAALAVLSIGQPSAAAAERAVKIFDRLDDARAAARNSVSLAFAQMQMGELHAAMEATARALNLYRAGNMTRTWAYAYALNVRADTLTLLGRFDEARDLFVESIALNEEIGDPLRAASVRADLAELECASGDLGAALSLAESAAATLHDAGFFRAEAITRSNASGYLLLLGRIDDAAAAARDALVLSQRAQNAQFVTIGIQHLATIAALRGDVQRAARLAGYVDAWYSAQGYARESTEQRTYDMLARALRPRLSEGEIARLEEHGAVLPEDAAAAEALTIAESLLTT
jgi:tetratricopeptide (TPR) repeat protein